MTLAYRYDSTAIAAAYLRSLIGLICTLGPLLVLQPASWLLPILVVGAALFLAYAVRAIARHTRRFVLDDNGIAAHGLFGATIAWSALRSVQLNYYSTRNDRSDGWIELLVRGPHASIRIESVVDGFAAIAARVAREAQQHACPLDERTLVHLGVMGVHIGATDARSAALPGAGHA